MRKLYDPATKYLAVRRSQLKTLVAKYVLQQLTIIRADYSPDRFVIYIFGGLFALMLAFSIVFDGNFLLSDFWFGRSIGWWFAIIIVVLAAVHSLLPDDVGS